MKEMGPHWTPPLASAPRAQSSAGLTGRFEIAHCDLKLIAARSAASGTLRRMADPAEEEVSLELVPAPAIEKRIVVVRERQVMLDEDLADLYGVETGAFDTSGQTKQGPIPGGLHVPAHERRVVSFEKANLASQTPGAAGAATRPTRSRSKGSRCSPASFRSRRAVAVNIEIMRAFVELRRAAASYARSRSGSRSSSGKPAPSSGSMTSSLPRSFRLFGG
jgi:hypothetical protein